RSAHDRATRIRKVGVFHLVCRPFGRFIRQYILKRGFLDGKAGLIFCMLSAFSSFLKYARLWEIIEKQKREAKISR
ncbi:MAG: glycosyltransferase family 2 protein, partial [Candidatus Sumerlaeota bacterium]